MTGFPNGRMISFSVIDFVDSAVFYSRILSFWGCFLVKDRHFWKSESCGCNFAGDLGCEFLNCFGRYIFLSDFISLLLIQVLCESTTYLLVTIFWPSIATILFLLMLLDNFVWFKPTLSSSIFIGWRVCLLWYWVYNFADSILLF